MTLRFATPKDAGQIRDIYAPSVTSTAVSFEETVPSETEIRARIETVQQKFPWIVAEENGAILGYAYASTHRDRAAYRWAVDCAIYIRRDQQGRGLGRRLYSKLFEILKQQGFYRVFAGVTLSNESSVRIHEAMGFKNIATYGKVGFKFGQWHDTGWWQLDLRDAIGVPEEPKLIHELNISFG